MNERHFAAPLFVRIWFWPLVLASLTVFGLLSALLGQPGIWWDLSWIALTGPLAGIAWWIHRS